MKRVVLLLISLWSYSAFSEDFVLKSLWKSNFDHPGKQYLAVVSDRDDQYSGDRVILFGNRNGRTSFHYFSLLSLNFYNQQGSKFESYDESMKLSGIVLRKNELLKVTVRSLNSNRSWNFRYRRYWSDASSSFAYGTLRKVEERLEELDSLYEPNSLLTFKRMLIRIKDRMGFIYEEGEDDLLPTFSQQTEQEWKITGPRREFAQSSIQKNGDDGISQELREADEWTQYTSIPRNGRGTYSSFSKKAYAFKQSEFKRGAEKFVKYEVTNVSFVRCGRRYMRVEHITWVLKDGSTFSYMPYLECDY